MWWMLQPYVMGPAASARRARGAPSENTSYEYDSSERKIEATRGDGRPRAYGDGIDTVKRPRRVLIESYRTLYVPYRYGRYHERCHERS